MNRCENGIISNCYPIGELMPYTGSVPFKYSADSSKLPTLSLREAARTKKDQLKCNCTGCKNRHCHCKGSGGYCTSHCHPKRARTGIVIVKDLEVIVQVTATQSVQEQALSL